MLMNLDHMGKLVLTLTGHLLLVRIQELAVEILHPEQAKNNPTKEILNHSYVLF